MVEGLKKLFTRYRSVVAYLFFGVCTTLVNIAAYYICARIFHLNTSASVIVAWFLAVIFAFLTNKSWVFGSKSWDIKTVTRELISFIICRAATGVMDLVIMLVTVDILHWNDMAMKIISNVLVIILNYVASKLIIFKKRTGDNINERRS